MPFVKKPPAGIAAPDEDAASLHAALRDADPEARWRAARALGGRAEAVPVLAAALGAEHVARVREAIMTALMRVGDAASVQALLPSLRAQDAGERAAAIEALQAIPGAVLPFLEALLADADSDVRILAAELARNLPEAEATRILGALITREAHANVCAAAIEVLAEVGTPDAIPALQACATRFAGSPFVPFAASVAIARLSGAEGPDRHGG
jgi:HEAT repeat protein